MKIFVLVNMHMDISMQGLDTLLLSSSCPLTDVLKRVGAIGPQKKLACVSMCVRQRDWEAKRERRNMSEFVLLRPHTLRPKELMPGAVWEEDFKVEAMWVIGCVCLCVCIRDRDRLFRCLSTCTHLCPGLFFSQEVLHFNFVSHTNTLSLIRTSSVKRTKIDKKRQTVCLDSKPLFCVVTSGAYMNTKAFSSLKANKNTNDWLDSFIETESSACTILRCAAQSSISLQRLHRGFRLTQYSSQVYFLWARGWMWEQSPPKRHSWMLRLHFSLWLLSPALDAPKSISVCIVTQWVSRYPGWWDSLSDFKLT